MVAIKQSAGRRIIKALAVILLISMATVAWDYRSYQVYKTALDASLLETARGNLRWEGRVGARQVFYIDRIGPFFVSSYPGRQYCSPELGRAEEGLELSIYYHRDCVLAWSIGLVGE